jgi:hypothetical protein
MRMARTVLATPSSMWRFPPQFVTHVRCAQPVHEANRVGATSLFARALSMKHSSKHVRRKTTKPSSADTEPAWGSKVPSPKLSEPMNSAGHVIWAWRRPIYRPSHWPRLSTYLGFGTIYPAQVSVRQGSHPLPPWQVKHFANRILLLTRSGVLSPVSPRLGAYVAGPFSGNVA